FWEECLFATLLHGRCTEVTSVANTARLRSSTGVLERVLATRYFTSIEISRSRERLRGGNDESDASSPHTRTNNNRASLQQVSKTIGARAGTRPERFARLRSGRAGGA